MSDSASFYLQKNMYVSLPIYIPREKKSKIAPPTKYLFIDKYLQIYIKYTTNNMPTSR